MFLYGLGYFGVSLVFLFGLGFFGMLLGAINFC